MEKQDAIHDDIEKRLEELRLDDKWHDEGRVYKQLNQTEAPSNEANQQVQEYSDLRFTRLTARAPQDEKEPHERKQMTPSPGPVVVEIPKQPETAPVREPPSEEPRPESHAEETPTSAPFVPEQTPASAPALEQISTSSPPPVQTAASGPDQPLIRFRRPVLNDDAESETYETLTMSEVQLMDSQVEAELQLSYEELRLALGEFDEVDEFEEIDEFEDEWEESAVGAGEWDVDAGVYCGGIDCGEEFLDDRD